MILVKKRKINLRPFDYSFPRNFNFLGFRYYFHHVVEPKKPVPQTVENSAPVKIRHVVGRLE